MFKEKRLVKKEQSNDKKAWGNHEINVIPPKIPGYSKALADLSAKLVFGEYEGGARFYDIEKDNIPAIAIKVLNIEGVSEDRAAEILKNSDANPYVPVLLNFLKMLKPGSKLDMIASRQKGVAVFRTNGEISDVKIPVPLSPLIFWSKISRKLESYFDGVEQTVIAYAAMMGGYTTNVFGKIANNRNPSALEIKLMLKEFQDVKDLLDEKSEDEYEKAQETGKQIEILMWSKHPELMAAVAQLWEADYDRRLEVTEIEDFIKKALDILEMISKKNSKMGKIHSRVGSKALEMISIFSGKSDGYSREIQSETMDYLLAAKRNTKDLEYGGLLTEYYRTIQVLGDVLDRQYYLGVRMNP
jgi:hypothetical protein